MSQMLKDAGVLRKRVVVLNSQTLSSLCAVLFTYMESKKNPWKRADT